MTRIPRRREWNDLRWAWLTTAMQASESDGQQGNIGRWEEVEGWEERRDRTRLDVSNTAQKNREDIATRLQGRNSKMSSIF